LTSTGGLSSVVLVVLQSVYRADGRSVVREEAEIHRITEFLRKSELVNLDMPVSKVVDAVSDLAPVGAGSLLIWSRWILVSPPCPQSSIVAIGSQGLQGSRPSSARVTMGESARIAMGESPASGSAP
jgi:hypothetical protein